MTSQTMADKRIATYLNRLESALRGVSPESKEDILREIRAHIMDSAEHSADQAGAIDRVLRLLGTPEELAARYSAECQLERASRSFLHGCCCALAGNGQSWASKERSRSL